MDLEAVSNIQPYLGANTSVWNFELISSIVLVCLLAVCKYFFITLLMLAIIASMKVLIEYYVC